MSSIYEFFESGDRYELSQIAADEELVEDIQKILIWLRLLDPPVDGKFGPITFEAFKEFQKYMDCPSEGILDSETAKKLIETDPSELFGELKLKLQLSDDFASRVIKYMLLKQYQISIRPGEYNIVYIEGMNADGTENNDAPNRFNDLRMVIEIQDGVPTIIGKWQATTEPGTYYTKYPLRSEGAARIQFNQFKAWRVGKHKDQYPALRQVRDITVHRDFNRDGTRTNDKLHTGSFGINQHHADNAPRHDIGPWSAGCLVGRMKSSHNEFMKIVMQDRRYKLNNSYIFSTTIIPGDDLLDEFPLIDISKENQPVRGIDISNNNPPINWYAVKRSGISFAFAKATEGATWVDKTFTSHWSKMKAAGIIRGAYHFCRPNRTAQQQAENFLRVVEKNFEPGDLPPVLDVEHWPHKVGREWRAITLQERIKLVEDWLEQVGEALGETPIIYTSPSFWKEYMNDTQALTRYPLWLAHYTSRSKPSVPANNWGGNGYTFWQYTERGRVSGVPGDVDINRYSGNFSNLVTLANNSFIA
ncbi:MAG: GH25 family lysozyme [Cyanobacteria bacterium J06643_5]